MASEKKISRTILTRKMFQQFLESDTTFENFIAKDMKITDIDDGKISFEITIQEYHLNFYKSIHGGVIASLVDLCGSLAVSTIIRRLSRVSTDINVSYIASVGYGDTLLVNAECVELGKTLIFTTVEVHNKADGKLIALGRHSMLVTGIHNDPENEFKTENAK
ncbi:12519_t:CDS:2, partial [Dentiscutata erythropus]